MRKFLIGQSPELVTTKPIPGFLLAYSLTLHYNEPKKGRFGDESINLYGTRQDRHHTSDTRRYPLKDIEEAYRIFENKLDGVIKIAIEP